jgi:hypothetical protein
MARTRIIIGHPAITGSRPPHLVYLGVSGSESEQALKADQSSHHYEIFEGPGRRKNNSTFNPSALIPSVNPVPPVTPVILPEDIKGLKKDELANALVVAIARIKKLEAAAQQEPQDGNPDANSDPA